MKKYCFAIIIFASVIGLSGCFITLPYYTNVNEPRVGPDGLMANDIASVPRASLAVRTEDLPKSAFVAVSISGGGSRAANFGAAALAELDDLGILQHVSMISCTSGGCLPAAYYALHGDNTDWDILRELLREDFFATWLTRMFYPHNFLRNNLTDFDRSDVMAGVFDDVFFKGAKFGDLTKKGPKLAINATDLAGEKFIFSSESFESHASRIDRFPLSYAVMASGAFPLIFNNVTLANFLETNSQKKRKFSNKPGYYLHLFDGGSVDNLGVRTVINVLDNAVASNAHSSRPRIKSCLIIAVDAYAGETAWVPRANGQSDARRGTDFLFDRNAVDATDSMLKHLRRNTLKELRPSGDTIHKASYWTHNLRVRRSSNPRDDIIRPCDIWHVTFERLDGVSGDTSLYPMLRGVETHYKLTGLGCSPEVIQSGLFEAARRLIRTDKNGTARACRWFKDAGLETNDCDVSYEPGRTHWPLTGSEYSLKCKPND